MNLLILGLLIYMIICPKEALQGATCGLLLWFETILPSLLPFIILSNILIHTDFISKVLTPFRKHPSRKGLFFPYSLYGIILGFLCGYPMGAKITADLYKEGKLSQEEAKHLLAFTNNPSPIFLLSYVMEGNLKTDNIVVPTFAILYISAIGTALLYPLLKGCLSPAPSLQICEKKAPKALPLGETIDASILNGFITITKLGGYMILTSIIVSGLKLLPTWRIPLKQLFICILELSTGIHEINTWAIPFSIRYILTVIVCAFGGCCVLLQTASVLQDSNLSLKPYLLGKVIQTFTAAVLALIIVQII